MSKKACGLWKTLIHCGTNTVWNVSAQYQSEELLTFYFVAVLV